MNLASSAPGILLAGGQGNGSGDLHLLLRSEGYRLQSARSTDELLTTVEKRGFDALLLDLTDPADARVISRVVELDDTLPVIAMTGPDRRDLATKALDCGARDFVELPIDKQRLLASVRAQVALAESLRLSRVLRRENLFLRRSGLRPLIADAPESQRLVERLETLARSETNVLLSGERGTGKQVLARWLHAMSNRRDRPLVRLSIYGLPVARLEREWHGDGEVVGVRAQCENATLFLDDFGERVGKTEVRLMELLERDGTAPRNTRTVFAVTSKCETTLHELAIGLDAVAVRVPPLRERREDIPALADHFLTEHANRFGKRVFTIADDAIAAAVAHDWPGNLRELDDRIEQALLRAARDPITAGDLALHQRAEPGGRDLTLREAERHLIQRALDRFQGNVSRAAESLGLSRSSLYRRIDRHRL